MQLQILFLKAVNCFHIYRLRLFHRIIFVGSSYQQISVTTLHIITALPVILFMLHLTFHMIYADVLF